MEKGNVRSKEQKKFQGKGRERPEIKDPRFAKALTDPRFRRIKSNQTKVKIDDRFAPMLTNPEFQISSKYDSRGKKVKVSARNPLKKYYEVEEKMDPDSVDDSEGIYRVGYSHLKKKTTSLRNQIAKKEVKRKATVKGKINSFL